MELPIDVIPNTVPPKFRWKSVVDTPNGKQVVSQEGVLPAAVERSVERLIGIVKQVLMDNATLQGQVKGLADRVAAQSDLLSKKAESQLAQNTLAKKSK